MCLADRIEHGRRFRALLSDLGLPHPLAAKMLQVSLRTLQNWMAGVNPPPYMAIKLLRLLRHAELPGPTWQGWSFSRGMLVTPEGRTISGNDSAWWSLLVRRAHGFSELYHQQKLDRLAHQQDQERASQRGRNAPPVDAGLVTVSTTHTDPQSTWGQYGVIIGSWPTISDFPPLSIPTPESVAPVSESALTPCSVLLSMPISGNPTPQQPKHPEAFHSRPHPPQEPLQAAQTSTPAIPGLRLTPLPGRLQLVEVVNPASQPQSANSPKPNAGKSPGWIAKPENSDGLALGRVCA